MSETVEVQKGDLEEVLAWVAERSTIYPGVPDDVDESAQALEKELEDC